MEKARVLNKMISRHSSFTKRRVVHSAPVLHSFTTDPALTVVGNKPTSINTVSALKRIKFGWLMRGLVAFGFHLMDETVFWLKSLYPPHRAVIVPLKPQPLLTPWY
jgi:hypothetical protein